MLGSLILYIKGVRIPMFQLSGFYYRRFWGSEFPLYLEPATPDSGWDL